MGSPTLNTPPSADPNYGAAATAAAAAEANINPNFTAIEIEFLESVLWFWEETSPLARPFESTNPEMTGYDPNLQMLTTIRQKLGVSLTR